MVRKSGWKPKLLGQGQKEHKMKQMAKKLLHAEKKTNWDASSHLSTLVAMTGALVIIFIIMRSLYLMYIKPDPIIAS